MLVQFLIDARSRSARTFGLASIRSSLPATAGISGERKCRFPPLEEIFHPPDWRRGESSDRLGEIRTLGGALSGSLGHAEDAPKLSKPCEPVVHMQNRNRQNIARCGSGR